MSDILYPRRIVAEELRLRQYRREYMAEAPYSLLGMAEEKGQLAETPAGPPPGTREPTDADKKELAERAREQRNQTGGSGPRHEMRK